MTIKELEERLDLPRASIRFYEREGLLSPARGENNYRDYSEEDARTLEKIKLLRQLHLDLNTIRRVQAGELTLASALDSQLSALASDRQALDRAEEVCRALRTSGEDWAALDPVPWLAELRRTPPPAAPHFQPPADTAPPLPVCPCPWRRLLARFLDLWLYGLIWDGVELLGLGMVGDTPAFLTWLLSYIPLFLMFLIEPFLLHFWGWTPGKWLLGLKVRDRQGNKLTLRRARQRLLRMFRRGYCYNIPIYNLVRMWKSRRRCLDGEPLEWDVDPDLSVEDDLAYEDLPMAWWRGVGWAAGIAACFGVILLMLLAGRMAPCRGPLTVAELARNYNHMVKVLDASEMVYPMEDNGTFQSPDNVIINLHTWFWEENLALHTDAEGIVSGFTFTWESTDEEETDFYLLPSLNAVCLLSDALAFSHPSLGLFSYSSTLDNLNKTIYALGAEGEVQSSGLVLERMVEAVGYAPSMEGSDYYLRQDGAGADAHITVTLTVTLDQ